MGPSWMPHTYLTHHANLHGLFCNPEQLIYYNTSKQCQVWRSVRTSSRSCRERSAQDFRSSSWIHAYEMCRLWWNAWKHSDLHFLRSYDQDRGPVDGCVPLVIVEARTNCFIREAIGHEPLTEEVEESYCCCLFQTSSSAEYEIKTATMYRNHTTTQNACLSCLKPISHGLSLHTSINELYAEHDEITNSSFQNLECCMRLTKDLTDGNSFDECSMSSLIQAKPELCYAACRGGCRVCA